MKILEHCCYTKYLNEWYSQYLASPSADTWTLIHFGDHMLWELLSWCITTAYRPGNGLKVTLVLPQITEQTLWHLNRMHLITDLQILTSQTPHPLQPLPTSPGGGDASQEEEGNQSPLKGVRGSVVVPGIHFQAFTVSSFDNDGLYRTFIFQGGLLQSSCPGKYLTSVSLSPESYRALQPQFDSWFRLYGKKTIG